MPEDTEKDEETEVDDNILEAVSGGVFPTAVNDAIT